MARALIKCGQAAIGEVVQFDSFNFLSIPKGYMILNGSVVDQANYELLHGPGSFARDNIANSPLYGKILIDAAGKIPVARTTLTQDGTAVRTYEGIAGNTVNLQHNHLWYNVASGDDLSYNSSGSTIVIESSDNGENGLYAYEDGSGTGQVIAEDCYNENQLSTTQSIKPHCMDNMFLIKVR